VTKYELTYDPMQSIEPHEGVSKFHANFSVITERGVGHQELSELADMFRATPDLYVALDELFAFVDEHKSNLHAEIPLSLLVNAELALDKAKGITL
jgi:hypothetical protein